MNEPENGPDNNSAEAINPENQRFGFIALMGAPNAGKSTLTNQLVGAKVSIVSPKVQTTRARIVAIAMAGAAQMVLVDTPGIFQNTRKRLERAMVEAAWSGAGDADIRVLLVDAKYPDAEDSQAIIKNLQDTGRRALLVLNKIDLIRRETLLAIAEKMQALDVFDRIFMLSALNGDGVADLRQHLAEILPTGRWHYPEDQLADISERLLAAEITREKIFLSLHQELPYASTVETESWEVKRDGSIRIGQVVFVERDSQKSIVLGKGGRRIKEIGQQSREELSEILGVKVHLFIFVKVRQNWGDDPERYREMGLDFTK